MYKCIRCLAEIDSLPKGMIRCPSCAGKILVKTRTPITKELKAI